MEKCIICGSKKFENNVLVSKDGTNYSKCTNCDLFFQPNINYKKLQQRYIKDFRPKITLLKKTMFILPFSIQYIGNFKILGKDTLNIKGKMLDIGSSCGKFMYLMKRKGWTVMGIEPTRHYVDFANRYLKVKTIEGFVEDFETEEKFDFINICAVLEHLERPDLLLKRVHNWIKKDRPVFIGVPLSTQKNRYKNHIYLFNKKNFELFMKKMNFKITKLKIPDNNNINAIVQKT